MTSNNTKQSSNQNKQFCLLNKNIHSVNFHSYIGAFYLQSNYNSFSEVLTKTVTSSVNHQTWLPEQSHAWAIRETGPLTAVQALTRSYKVTCRDSHHGNLSHYAKTEKYKDSERGMYLPFHNTTLPEFHFVEFNRWETLFGNTSTGSDAFFGEYYHLSSMWQSRTKM